MEQSDSSVVGSSRVLVPRQRNNEQQCRCCAGKDRETTSSNVDVVQGNKKKTLTNATDCMGGSDEQGRPVDEKRLPA